MAVGSAFDQWRKDPFFNAAEEVQESADTMESMYRMWARDRRIGFNSEASDEVRRELHTALGTAKWQLEEFERAVNLSHEKYSSEENTITRHRLFIAAIKNQIRHIENALSDSLIGEGKQPLSWVQLDEEERDDLALFLSPIPQISHEEKDSSTYRKDIAVNSQDAKSLEPSSSGKSEDEGVAQVAQPNDSWEIQIDDEKRVDKRSVDMRQDVFSCLLNRFGIIRSVDFVAKLRWFKNSFWKAKSEEHLQLRRGFSNYLEFNGISRFAQRFSGLTERSRSCFSGWKDKSLVPNVQKLSGRVDGVQQHLHGARYSMLFGRSLRITFLLLLSIILIVPFLLYST